MSINRSLSSTLSPLWRVGVTLSALVLSVAAFGAAAATTAKPTAPTAQADEQQLEEVIVTARRKSESLQDVPQTVSAITAGDVQKLNILHFEDINKLVAGLQVTGSGGGLNTSIRGVTFNTVSNALTPTMAQFINDAAVTPSANAQSFFDVGQVEILRGPQGTTRGTAAPSGAITVTTHRPDLQKIGGSLNVTGTNLHGRNIQGAINFPIIEGKLGVRLATLYDENDFGGVHSANSSIDPSSNTKAQRVSVRFVPTDNITADVMYQRLRRRELSFGSAVFGAGAPGGTFSAPSGAGFNNTGITTAGYNGPVIGPFDYLAVGEKPNDSQANVDIITGELGWTFAGQKLSYVGSNQKYDSLIYAPQDGLNAIPNYDHVGFQSVKSHTTSHELRLASVERIAGVLDYVVGAFNYYNNNLIYIPDYIVAALNPGSFGPPAVPFTPHSPNERYLLGLTIDLGRITNELSYFGNMTVHLGDKFEISGGARSIRSKAHITTETRTTASFIALPFPAAVCGAIGGQFGVTYPNVCDRPIAAGAAAPYADVLFDHKPWVYDLSAAYHVNPDLMVYVHAGTSWREGPFTIGLSNATNDPAINKLILHTPETSRSAEVGVKWSFLDHRGRLNVDYFHQTYDGLIYTSPFAVYYLANNGVTSSVTQNGFTSNANAKVDGIDVEVAFELTKRWSASSGFSWADGKLSGSIPCNDGNFDGIADAIVPTVASFQAAGVTVAYCQSNAATTTAPKWHINMQSEYWHPLTARANGFVRGLVNYDPKNPNASQIAITPAYTTVDFYVGVRGKDRSWEVSLFAKNATATQEIASQSATNLSYFAGLSSVFGTSGYKSISLLPRREIGLTASYRFDAK